MMLLSSPRAPGVRPGVWAVHAGQTGQGGEQSRAQTPSHRVSSPQGRLLGQVVDKRHPEHQQWNVLSNTFLSVISLVVLVVDVGQRSLLRGAHHLVTPPGHQTVHHIHRVIAGPLQHKPENRELNCAHMDE